MYPLPRLSSSLRLSLRKASSPLVLGFAALLPLCAALPAHAQSWVFDPTQSTQDNHQVGYSVDSLNWTNPNRDFDEHTYTFNRVCWGSFQIWGPNFQPSDEFTMHGNVTASISQKSVYVWASGTDNTGKPIPALNPPAKAYFLLRGNAYSNTFAQGEDAAMLAAASSFICTADDGLGDAPVTTSGTGAGNYINSTSTGSHLVQKDGSSGTVTFSFNPSGHVEGTFTNPWGTPDRDTRISPFDGSGQTNAEQVNVYQDSRALTISSKLGTTFHKSSTRFDSNGVALPDPDIPDSDGTVHANSVVPSASTSNMDEGTDQYDILYHANVSGGWAANSTYHWHLSLAGQPTQIQNSFPDGTFTLPGDPPLDYRGEYDQYKAPAGAQEHAYIHLTDAQDGSDGTANYYVTFHALTENWQLWHTGDLFWQEANLDHCDGDNDSTGTLAYAYHNTTVTGHFMYTDEEGGVNTALIDMFAVGTGLVDPPWAGFIAAVGIAYSQVQPQDNPTGVAFNTAWNVTDSTGIPAGRDPSLMDFYRMRPILLVQYQPQFWRGDAYGTQGYTGGATESFNKFTGGVKGAGDFSPTTQPPPGG